MALRDRPVLDWMIAMRTPEANALIAWFSDIGGPVGRARRLRQFPSEA